MAVLLCSMTTGLFASPRESKSCRMLMSFETSFGDPLRVIVIVVCVSDLGWLDPSLSRRVRILGSGGAWRWMQGSGCHRW